MVSCSVVGAPTAAGTTEGATRKTCNDGATEHRTLKSARGIQIEHYPASPSDAELGHFLCPFERPIDTHVFDDDHELRMRPAGISMWLLVLSLLPVTGVMIYVLGFSDMIDGTNRRIAIATLGSLCLAAIFGIVILINRYENAHAPSLIVDKKRRTLTLPRHDAVFDDFERLTIVEVYGWHRRSSARYTHTNELTLLASEADGTCSRYTLYVATSHRKVMRAIKNFSETMGIPHKRIRTVRSGQQKLRD